MFTPPNIFLNNPPHFQTPRNSCYWTIYEFHILWHIATQRSLQHWPKNVNVIRLWRHLNTSLGNDASASSHRLHGPVHTYAKVFFMTVYIICIRTLTRHCRLFCRLFCRMCFTLQTPPRYTASLSIVSPWWITLVLVLMSLRSMRKKVEDRLSKLTKPKCLTDVTWCIPKK